MKYIHNVDTYQDYIASYAEKDARPNLSLIQDRNVVYNINDQIVNIGNGTSSSRYFPTYVYYYCSLTQQIYTPSEIGVAGNITAIAFKVYNNKTITRKIRIYIRHTSKNAFDSSTSWDLISNDSYYCYDGPVNFKANGWTVIPFIKPFSYNGTSNLLVCISDYTYLGSGTSTSSALSYYCHSTGANKTLYYYSSSGISTSDSNIVKLKGTLSTYSNNIKLCINSAHAPNT